MLEGFAIGHQKFEEELLVGKAPKDSLLQTPHFRLIPALDMQPPSASIHRVMAKKSTEGTLTAAAAEKQVHSGLQETEEAELQLLETKVRKFPNVHFDDTDERGKPIIWQEVNFRVCKILDRSSGALLSIVFPDSGRLELGSDSPHIEQQFDLQRIAHIVRSVRNFRLSLCEQSSHEDRESALFAHGRYIPSSKDSKNPLALDRLRGRYILRREQEKLIIEIDSQVYEDIAPHHAELGSVLQTLFPHKTVLHREDGKIYLPEPVNAKLFTELLNTLDSFYLSDDSLRDLPRAPEIRRHVPGERTTVSRALRDLLARRKLA